MAIRKNFSCAVEDCLCQNIAVVNGEAAAFAMSMETDSFSGYEEELSMVRGYRMRELYLRTGAGIWVL